MVQLLGLSGSLRKGSFNSALLRAAEGKGLGGTLIRAGLAAARERGLKVIPICPFFAAYMQKHAEVHDLLDDVWRTRFGLQNGA